MHRSTVRLFVGVLAVAVLAAPLTAEAAPSHARAAARAHTSLHAIRGRALGVIPVRGSATSAATGRVVPGASKLEYHGGPVMLSSTTYTIFWEPTTCGSEACSVDPNYFSGLNTYFQNAALDSGTNGNVYSTLNQYYEIKHGRKKHVKYQQTFGGTATDTTAFPSNGCTPNGYSVSNVCLSDSQIRSEVQKVMKQQGWTGTKSHAFFLVLPSDVGTCYASGHCAFSEFCAYHSNFTNKAGEPVIYANIPYGATALGGCDSGFTPPNNEDLDSTLNAMSHEHREMTNDPFGTGWWDDTYRYEGSDQCAYDFGTTQGPGGPNNGDYNQTIGANVYLIQTEWSNKTTGCVLHG